MSVKELLSLGIQPDIIVQRTDKRSSKDIKHFYFVISHQ